MSSQFNYLRSKWPKLAALASNAARLVDIAPASAISSMRTFCEWSAEVMLDIYDIPNLDRASQLDKLDALQATDNMPADIIQKFHNVRTAGNRAVHEALGDPEEAHDCIKDIDDIGHWMTQVSDISTGGAAYRMPSSSTSRTSSARYSSYNSSSSTSGYTPQDIGYSSTSSYHPKRSWTRLTPRLTLIAGAAVVVLLVIVISVGINRLNKGKNVPDDIAGSPTIELNTAANVNTNRVEPDITPAPIQYEYLENIEKESSSLDTYYLGKWGTTTYEEKFAIGDKVYEHGIGMYISSNAINELKGTLSIVWELDGKYDKLYFDLGIDSKWQYGEGYGQYKIEVFLDDDEETAVFATQNEEYTVQKLAQVVELDACDKMTIRLTQYKGDEGTLNVVLGDIKLSLIEEETPTDDATPTIAPSQSPAVDPT